MAVRHSLEYMLFGLSAATRQQVITQTTNALSGRIKEEVVNALEPNRDVSYRDAAGDTQVEQAAFAEINEFLAKQDGDQIFDFLRGRAESVGATTSPLSGKRSYLRLTSSDDETGEVIRRISRSPSWPDDPGSIISG